jgi:hypothetical protein
MIDTLKLSKGLTGEKINIKATIQPSSAAYKGIYQHCSERHLHRYSHRVKTGYDDAARAERALLGVKGKRLTYETTAQG